MPGSFRQLLLAAFVLIAVLLGSMSLRALSVLGELVERSGSEADHALALQSAMQALAAHTAGMERNARQSLVLHDRVLRERFRREGLAARAALDDITDAGIAAGDAGRWRARVLEIASVLDRADLSALARERAVAAQFRELQALDDRIAAQVQQHVAERDHGLRLQLATQRTRLTRQVAAVVALAVLLAIGLGFWLARPFKRIEQAITQLGRERLDQAIAIPGPLDVRRVGRQLDWLRQQLAEAEAGKTRFFRHVSHELKTPLAALREGISLLQDGVAGRLNADQEDVLRILHQNALVLQRHIEALLRFNAAAFDARRLQRRRTDLLALLQAQVEAQRLQWQARRLAVQVEGKPLSLPVDADKIGTAVGNLLANAIRFSPEGAAIRLQLSDAPGVLRIDVRDQGPGVAEADRERVFDPFYRGQHQPDSAVRGTGIGLSLVREYVDAHGGAVRILPSDGGAHFQIELPHAS